MYYFISCSQRSRQAPGLTSQIRSKLPLTLSPLVPFLLVAPVLSTFLLSWVSPREVIVFITFYFGQAIGSLLSVAMDATF